MLWLVYYVYFFLGIRKTNAFKPHTLVCGAHCFSDNLEIIKLYKKISPTLIFLFIFLKSYFL
jgi:hypothetical protein